LRSNDGGFTWGDTIRVDIPDSLIKQMPTITVEDPDEPIVQYIELHQDLSIARQVITRMTEGSFGTPMQVSSQFAPGNACGSAQGQLVSKGDHVAALFGVVEDAVSALWGAFSNDGGESFLFGSQLNTAGGGACAIGPDGVITGDSITYVWTSSAENGQLVHIGRASMLDGGVGYNALMLPGAGAVGQYYPRIAGSGDTLGVVWRHHSNGGMEVLFSWSVSGPSGFGDPDTVNIELSGLQREPDIAYANGSFHIVWRDSGSGNVRYRKASLANPVGIEEIRPPSKAMYWPNPASELVMTDAPEGRVVEICDLQGRKVAQEHVRNGCLDVSTLSPGTYFFIVMNSGQPGAVMKIAR
jgi:hypothetical protein